MQADLDFALESTRLALVVMLWLAWFIIIVGSCWLVAAVYWLRDWWRKRGR